MKILVMNAGSSSQKSCLYEIGNALPAKVPEPLWEAKIDWTHQPNVAELKVTTGKGELKAELPADDRPQVIQQLLQSLWTGETQVIADPQEITVVGHRVVHGGQDYHSSIRITPDVKAAIDRLSALAPVHNPANLEGIEAIEQFLGDVPQVAVFDTAFHAQMPDAAAIYPGEYDWVEKGIRRYGFHGTSHRYCADRVAELMGRNLNELRLITCHLGNGCSLAAIQNGHSIDTTMGFTPLDGLMMGTRSGSVDPSILIYLMRQEGYTADQLDQVLNKKSGLLGISGISNDLRSITEAIEFGNTRAKLALDIYIHRLRRELGGMLMSLGGLDGLVFTGGVGENSARVRSAACEPLSWLGIKLDPHQFVSREDTLISAPDSATSVWVIHTQEDWTIARDCWEILVNS
ncbi:acetate/propionate family kinase [Leptolyngbya ohadii]|uniref:acetate/propionate family kinase n=1 Tax=Leptolyngbya ohadii TaxID=1962290 RepID=UPI000B59DB19|nr:acetate kinase [Leptolyngbya ohadii]